MKKKHPFQKRNTEGRKKSFFTSVLTGSVISLLSGIALLAVFSFPALAMEDPLRFAPVFGITALFLSVIIGSYISARVHGKNGLACGALSALLTVAALIVLTFAMKFSIRTELFLICAPALIISACIAGVCGVSTEEGGTRKKSVSRSHLSKF